MKRLACISKLQRDLPQISYGHTLHVWYVIESRPLRKEKMNYWVAKETPTTIMDIYESGRSNLYFFGRA